MTESINSDSSLEQNVFQEDIDYKVFQAILDILDGIQAIFVSRKEFNEKKGDFMEENGENKYGMQYNLYLPKDLKINELPSIIYRVNKITFGEELPEYASSNELKIKIVLAVDTLLEELKKDRGSKKRIKKALKNYVRLYAQIFGEEEALKLNKEEYKQCVLNSGNIDKYKSYEEKLVKIQTLESLGEVEDGIEKIVAQELENHFFESFLERGVNKIRLGLMTITQTEQENLDPTKEGISTHLNTEDLDKKERLLREKIGIDLLKQELEELRKKGNPIELEAKELEATNKILDILYEYPYQMTENNYGYQPKEILKSKEIYCVGFSLIGHSFLSELGIKHNGLMIPGHSTLEILIGKRKYYFDATASNKVIEIEYKEKMGTYTRIKAINGVFREKTFVISGDTENILLAHIYNNKGNDLLNSGKPKEAIVLYDKAIKLFPNDYTAYYNKGKALDKIGRIEKAIIEYDKAIERNPIYSGSYNNKGICLGILGKYNESLVMYNKGLELNSNDLNIIFNKGNALLNSGKPEEAIVLYDKALDIKPNYRQALNNKGNALYNLGKYKEALILYNRTLEFYDKHIGTFFNAGKCLEKLKQPEKALDMYYQVLELDSKHIKTYRNIGNILVSSGDYAGALDIYNTAIKLNPNNPELYYEIGNILDMLKKYEKAELAYKKSIELDSKNPDYYLDRGVSLYYLNRFQDAIAMFEKSINLSPQSNMAYTNKGMCLIQLGNSKLAELYLYIGSILEGSEVSFEITCIEEIEKINKFLKYDDFEGLRLFLEDMDENLK